MKKGYIISLALLVILSGCRCKKKCKDESKQTKKTDLKTNIDIPTAQDSVKSFFDEDTLEFTLADDPEDITNLVAENSVAPIDPEIDYAWVDDSYNTNFRTVYFDFDSYTVRPDQESSLAYDIATAKKMVEDNQKAGVNLPTIIIDGHACHSAGSRAYNLALSEKRAKILADRFVQAGIPQDCLKIVGRGSELPALIDGQPVCGSRDQQWPNRRDELHIVYS